LFDLLTWGAEALWHHAFESQGFNVRTGEREKWYNSKYDIVFGDTANSVIGFGRQAFVLGPGY